MSTIKPPARQPAKELPVEVVEVKIEGGANSSNLENCISGK